MAKAKTEEQICIEAAELMINRMTQRISELQDAINALSRLKGQWEWKRDRKRRGLRLGLRVRQEAAEAAQ